MQNVVYHEYADVFYQIIDRASEGESFTITNHEGNPRAVIIGITEFDQMKRTLEALTRREEPHNE